jgi:hypothetical protein
MATRTRSRPHRIRRLTVTFGVVVAAVAWILVAGYGGLPETLLLWSLVAAPLAVLAYAYARHSDRPGPGDRR